ncbi:MAG: TolC family protein [Dysgonamonadaceae bacterium]|jgi:outer membrane protein|nr:TolC family protein [Dysgonamonadaceae bacterium]
MKKTVISLIIGLCIFSVHAQVKLWTLEECIQYAVEHNITIKRMEIQKNVAEVDLNTAQMSRLPDLSANAGQNWNFGRTQTSSGLYEVKNQGSSSFSISSSVPIFTGFRIPNEIAKNKLELQTATENLAKAKEDLSLNIASLFLQALFNKELVKINKSQLELSESQVQRTEVLVDAGKVPASQLYDIKAQVANDKVSVIQAENNLNLALLDLRQSLELEGNSEFDIFVPEINNVVEENISSVQPVSIVFDNALQVKPVVRAQEYVVESAEKTLQIAKSGYLPTLSLNFRYGTSYYHLYDKNFNNTSFSNQFKNNAEEYIGLNLNIPIFNRFSVRNQVRNARFNIENQKLVLENVKKDLYKEIQTAYLNAVSSQEKYKASQEAVISTSESFKYAQERYEIGKSSVFEFNEAKTKLVRSQLEEAQSKYDYIFRAKILDFYNGVPIKL